MYAVIIIAYNNVEFVLQQHSMLKAFCTDKYQLIIVDNSNKIDASDAIRYHCNRLNSQYIRTVSAHVNGSESHAFAANIAYNKFRSSYKAILFLDHDCFPIKKFSIEKSLSGNLIYGLGQQDNKYYWPGCLFVDCILSVDFSPMPGMDTGGGTSKIIQQLKSEIDKNGGADKFSFFDEAYCQNPYFNKSQYDFYSLLCNGTFMHFINGSNWNNSPDNEERINCLINVLVETAKANLNNSI